MSDESTPPPLRLKPRVRPESEPSAAPAPAPSPEAKPGDAGTTAGAGSAPKLRLKPSLPVPAAEPTAPAPAATAASEPLNAVPEPDPAAPEAATPPPAPIRLKPRMTTEPAATPGAEHNELPPGTPPPAAADEGASKFKLKPKSPAPLPEPAAPAPSESGAPPLPPPPAKPPPPPPPPLASAPPTIPPAPPLVPAAPVIPAASKSAPAFPLMASPEPPAQKLPPPVPHVRVENLPAEGEPSGAPTVKAAKPVKQIVLAALVLVLAVAAFVLYWQTRTPSAPPRSTAKPASAKPAGTIAAAGKPTPTATTPPATPGPTPSATLNQIAAAPGQAVGKARAVVAARRTNEQGRVDALGDEATGAAALNPPPPGQPTGSGAPKAGPAKTTSTAELAPGVTATTTVMSDLAGDGSPAFRSWVGAARINGVFQGSPARALINGRTFRAGQTVDDALGIVFDGIDAGERMIVFRDASGATIARKY